jgi:hypothetical protein
MKISVQHFYVSIHVTIRNTSFASVMFSAKQSEWWSLEDERVQKFIKQITAVVGNPGHQWNTPNFLGTAGCLSEEGSQGVLDPACAVLAPLAPRFPHLLTRETLSLPVLVEGQGVIMEVEILAL